MRSQVQTDLSSIRRDLTSAARTCQNQAWADVGQWHAGSRAEALCLELVPQQAAMATTFVDPNTLKAVLPNVATNDDRVLHYQHDYSSICAKQPIRS